MIKTVKSGFINQAFGVGSDSIVGTLTDASAKGKQELLSLADANQVKITFIDGSVFEATLPVNAHIAFNMPVAITTSGDVIVS